MLLLVKSCGNGGVVVFAVSESVRKRVFFLFYVERAFHTNCVNNTTHFFCRGKRWIRKIGTIWRAACRCPVGFIKFFLPFIAPGARLRSLHCGRHFSGWHMLLWKICFFLATTSFFFSRFACPFRCSASP